MKNEYTYSFCSKNFTILWLVQSQIKNIKVSNKMLALTAKLYNDEAFLYTESMDYFKHFDFSLFIEKHTMIENFIEINHKVFERDTKEYLKHSLISYSNPKTLGAFSTVESEIENQEFFSDIDTTYEHNFEFAYDNTLRFVFGFFFPMILYSLVEFYVLFLILFKLFNWNYFFIEISIDEYPPLQFTKDIVDSFFFFLPSLVDLNYGYISNFSLFILLFYLITFFAWFIFVVVSTYQNFIESINFDDDEEEEETGNVDNIYEEDNMWSLDEEEELYGSDLSLITFPIHFFFMNFAAIFVGIYFYLLGEVFLYVAECTFFLNTFIGKMAGFDIHSDIYNTFFFILSLLLLLLLYFIFFTSKKLEHYRANKFNIGVRELFRENLEKSVSIKTFLKQNFYVFSKFLAVKEVWSQTQLVNLNFVYLKYIWLFIKNFIKIFILFYVSSTLVGFFYNFIDGDRYMLILLDNIREINWVFEKECLYSALMFTKLYFLLVFAKILNIIILLQKIIINLISLIFFISTTTFYCIYFIVFNLQSYIYFKFFSLLTNLIYAFISLNVYIINIILDVLCYKSFLYLLKSKMLLVILDFSIEIFNYSIINMVYLSYVFIFDIVFWFLLYVLKIVLFIIVKFIKLFKIFYTLIKFLFYYVKIFCLFILKFLIFYLTCFGITFFFMRLGFKYSFEYNLVNWVNLLKTNNPKLKQIKIKMAPLAVIDEVKERNLQIAKDRGLGFKSYLEFKQFLKEHLYFERLEHAVDRINTLKPSNIRTFIFIRDLFLYLPNTLINRFKVWYFKEKKYKLALNIHHLYIYLFQENSKLKTLVHDDARYKELEFYRKKYGSNSDLFNTEDHKMPTSTFLNSEFTLVCILIYSIYEKDNDSGSGHKNKNKID